MLHALNPAARADQTLARNMKLLAQHELAGFGGLGEGMSMQLTRDGRRILDVSDLTKPRNIAGDTIRQLFQAVGAVADRAKAK